MLPKIVLALILLPLIELGIFIKLGPVLGFWTTIGIVVGSAIFGLVVGQFAGLRAIHRIQETIAKGELPGDAIIDAGLILAASISLFLPGLLTTVIGLLLLIPPLRRPIRYLIRKKLAESIISAGPSMMNSGSPFGGSFQQSNLLHDRMHSNDPYDDYDPYQTGHANDDQGEIIDITPAKPSNENSNSSSNHEKDENQ